MPPAAVVALAGTALFAVLDWVAVARRSKTLEYVFKPATMVALVVAVLAMASGRSGLDGWQVGLWVAALTCSLAGDVFLMLPNEAFIPGLASFLVGHLFYIAGFWVTPLGTTWAAGLAALVAVVFGVYVGGRIVRGVEVKAERVAVTVYVGVICLMLGSALTSPWRYGVPWPAAAAAVAGATLFTASDTMIGWRRYVTPFRGERLGVIVTYHVGQVLLALSLLR